MAEIDSGQQSTFGSKLHSLCLLCVVIDINQMNAEKALDIVLHGHDEDFKHVPVHRLSNSGESLLSSSDEEVMDMVQDGLGDSSDDDDDNLMPAGCACGRGRGREGVCGRGGAPCGHGDAVHSCGRGRRARSSCTWWPQW